MFEITAAAPESADYVDEESVRALGRITIGSFTEHFAIPLGYWHVDDYRRNWCAALQFLEVSKRAISCLAVSVSEPDSTDFIFCWPLYRDGDIVHVQNSLIFLDEVGSFDPNAPWQCIQPRATVNEDGATISEWDTDMDSIRRFRGLRCGF